MAMQYGWADGYSTTEPVWQRGTVTITTTPMSSFTGLGMPKPDPRPKTIIVDLDGTIFKHRGSMHSIVMDLRRGFYSAPLPGVVEKFTEWEAKGYNIIILTGRPECIREETIAELKSCGLFFTQLVMGVGGGERILINDKKPNGSITARAENVERDAGIRNILW